jgi:glucose-6-phosphate-specific signal transduction histidine kinase
MSAENYGERRGFERALHDGVQQHLVALAVNLQLTQLLCDTDPDAVQARLEELRRDVHAALDEARRLGNDIYPPVLTDHGVAEALRSAGVRVDAKGLGRYGPDVEAGAYFACARAGRVRLWDEQGSLRFEVLD